MCCMGVLLHFAWLCALSRWVVVHGEHFGGGVSMAILESGLPWVLLAIVVGLGLAVVLGLLVGAAVRLLDARA